MNKTSTKSQTVIPPPKRITHEDGRPFTCAWDSGVVVEAYLHQRNRRGKYRVKVLYGEQQVGSGNVDLEDLNDRERLHAECSHLDGQVGNWLAYLMRVSDAIAALPTEAEASWELDVVTLADIQPERKDYLWYPLLPRRAPVVLDGDPGVGKSALVIRLIAHLTTGTAFPALFPTEHLEQGFAPRHVCLLTYEDDPASTILPRVSIHGGNPALVHLLQGKKNSQSELQPLTMQDILMLEEALARFNPALLVFDPIQSFLGPHVDMNDAGSTRPVLDPISALCRRHDCTPLYIRHTGKSSHAKAMHAGLGSIDIMANMRCGLALYDDPEHPQRRILAQTKTNGRRAPSLQCLLSTATHDYLLDDGEILTVEDVRLDWDGLSTLTAADLNAQQWVQPRTDEEEQSALEQARAFLRELLKGGAEVPYPEVMQAVKEAGVTTATLKRAKALEHVTVRKQGGSGTPWLWRLPASDTGETRDSDESEDEAQF
jgi:hypothetical protein